MKIDILFTSHQMDIILATLANETDVYSGGFRGGKGGANAPPFGG